MLALIGAIALHVIAFVSFDAVVTYTPKRKIEIPPRVELVDLSLPTPAPPKPAEPPPPSKAVEPPTPAPKAPLAPARAPAPARVASAQPKATPTEPPPAAPPSSAPAEGGHEQTYNLPEGDVADSLGKHGPVTDDRIGGKGKGKGEGDGSGSGAVAPITSIATIKTPAKVKGDFSYFGEKDYPAEAKTLGIEGDIKVQLVVDDKGQVVRKRLLTKLGHGLDELALAKAAQLAFEPALDTEDKPVTSVVVWTFHMTLPK